MTKQEKISYIENLIFSDNKIATNIFNRLNLVLIEIKEEAT
jgi:hypothetical protein